MNVRLIFVLLFLAFTTTQNVMKMRIHNQSIPYITSGSKQVRRLNEPEEENEDEILDLPEEGEEEDSPEDEVDEN